MENRKRTAKVGVDFDANVPGDVETDSTGKNILIRDPDVIDDTSELSILDYSPPDDSESDKSVESEQSGEANEFDPYNSGSFDMSKSELAKFREWKTKSRK